MRGKLLIATAALLLAGTLGVAAQQPSRDPGQQSTPQEPRGTDDTRSTQPSGQLPPTPEQRRFEQQEQRGPRPGTTGQSTPQEPRGTDDTRSTYPSGGQLPPTPEQRARERQ